MADTSQNENSLSKSKLIESNLGSNSGDANNGVSSNPKLSNQQVPVTATNTKQMQQFSNNLCKQSRSRFDSEFLKALRNSKSAPPHMSAQLMTLGDLSELEGQKGRPKTCLDKDRLANISGSEDGDGARNSKGAMGANGKHDLRNANDPNQTDGTSQDDEEEDPIKKKFDPSIRFPLSEEFPSLSAEEIQEKLENTWTQVSMTLLTRPQFQSQRERVMEWLEERGNQNPITNHPILDIM